jgi:hypothetical protein
MNSIRCTLTVAAMTFLLALLALAQQSDTTSRQSGQMQGMHQGMQQGQQSQHGQLSDMMQECHSKMRTMMRSNEQVQKDVAAAKQSNDTSQMRAALDEADKALTAMHDHMTSCMNMMGSMHNPGNASGQQKQPSQP